MQPDFTKLKPVGESPNFAMLKPVEIEPVQEEQKIGGFQSFVRSIASPFLKVASTGRAIIDQATDFSTTSEEIAKREYDYGYLGKSKALQNPLESIGVGAELGSYAIGGGGTAKTIVSGLKGKILKGAMTGLKTGASAGGTVSLGQSLQDAENTPMDVAYNTLFGTALGGVTGGVLGAATPAVVKGVNAVKGYTGIANLETKLADGYKKIFNPTARQIKVDSRFGNDSFKFLAQELPDLPIEVNSAGRVIADDAIEMAKQKYIAEATAYKPIIRNSGKYVNVDDIMTQAKKNVAKELDGSDLLKAQNQVDDEINSFLVNNPQDVNVMADGKRFVTLSRADDIKSYSWSRGKGWGTPEAEVWNDTNNIIGHAFKDAIEKELPSAPIKAMNRRLGQWKNAIDMMERRNGNVSGSGGKLGKYIYKSLGTSVGAGLGGEDGGVGGGILGAGTGFMTATALASAMANPNVRLFVVRRLLQNLQKAGRGDMIKEAEDILRQESSRYLLPASGKTSYIEKPIILPKSVRETNLGIDEVKNASINTQENRSLPAQVPSKKTANVKKNIPQAIDENVPQTKANVNTKKKSSFVSIGGKIFKAIPDATKKEMVSTMDYLNQKGDKFQFDAKKDRVLNDIMKKYNINPDWSNNKIADTIEKLIENTKTS